MKLGKLLAAALSVTMCIPHLSVWGDSTAAELAADPAAYSEEMYATDTQADDNTSAQSVQKPRFHYLKSGLKFYQSEK